MQTGTLYIISSPSGAGKSSLLSKLLDHYSSPKSVQMSVSHTTRTIRPGEQHGVHYHFVESDAFKELIERNAFLEWAEVFGNYYGTSRALIEEALANGIDVFLDIDWQGARQIREAFPECRSIFLLPPGKQELEKRLKQRGQDSDEVIAGRMAQAVSEMSHHDEYDYLIINDDFETAFKQLCSIVEAERLRSKPQQIKHQPLIQQLLEK